MQSRMASVQESEVADVEFVETHGGAMLPRRSTIPIRQRQGLICWNFVPLQTTT
jgi:hypothetical protein